MSKGLIRYYEKQICRKGWEFQRKFFGFVHSPDIMRIPAKDYVFPNSLLEYI
jgi:hypothetical protein